MDTLAAILDESESWTSVRHNYRPNQVHCTLFRVCIYCGSGEEAITRNSTWPPGGHIEFKYWPKMCMNFIITTSVTQLLDMKWFQEFEHDLYMVEKFCENRLQAKVNRWMPGIQVQSEELFWYVASRGKKKKAGYKVILSDLHVVPAGNNNYYCIVGKHDRMQTHFLYWKCINVIITNVHILKNQCKVVSISAIF